MKYKSDTYTLPQWVFNLVKKLKTDKSVNKSAFVTQAILEKIEREYPDLLKSKE
jgi:hypothetical protein